ncbi:MAG TPA: ATP-binding cassette domain-containing protein [Candidatus Limnocylindrales bacterium]|nr:ATP-binding cassette domain-containing protein [Candidatus Limnocylindrales bacterium]
MFIGTENLTHVYMPGTSYAAGALQDVSFSLERGEFAVIIGPSGSGKSTLVQHLNGLLKPTAGRVFFKGRTVCFGKQEMIRLRRQVGLVFQMPEEQFFSDTVYDEVAFAPRNLGLSAADESTRVEEALEQVGLKARLYRDRHPFQLSAGQKRLVAIASVLSLKPEVLILDEPTAALDFAGRHSLFNLLADLNRNLGITILVATHHLDEAASLADSVFVLKDGRLVLAGLATDIFRQREQLRKIGLALPPITEIMYGLADRGLPVDPAVFTLSDARRVINTLKRRH